jgi:hypothetical protein
LGTTRTHLAPDPERGANRCDVLFSQADRLTYLRLVSRQRQEAGVRVQAWYFNDHHLYFVVVPVREESLV